MKIFNFLLNNYQTILTGIGAVLTGIIGVCMSIPGPEPERTLNKLVDFLSKFSKK